MSADGTTDSDTDTTAAGTDRDVSGGAHQGPGRWARRGAAGIGMPPGESGSDRGAVEAPPTPDIGDPDISPSLAGGHAGATRTDQTRPAGD